MSNPFDWRKLPPQNEVFSNGIMQLSELVRIGALMSNVIFNLSQSRSLPEDYRETLRRLHIEWDAAYAKLNRIEPMNGRHT